LKVAKFQNFKVESLKVAKFQAGPVESSTSKLSKKIGRNWRKKRYFVLETDKRLLSYYERPDPNFSKGLLSKFSEILKL
jgi:hypothetical protein